jgi:(S)-ureidoglycine-glyoxylate aminotransferase
VAHFAEGGKGNRFRVRSRHGAIADPMSDRIGELLPGARILLGPGPSMADPRVLRAMATPLLGQLDPEFTAIMNDVMALSRCAFQTENLRSFPVSGTGRAGLEAAIGSLVEPGERVVVAECGRFGLLLIEIAERCGADVAVVRGEWGRAIDPAAVEAALASGKTKLVATIHGETSTGVLQPLEDLARLAHAHGALFMTDAVVTLGGCEVAVDRWGVDIAVAGTQKCLSCPSGLAPVTFNARAEAAIRARRTKVRSNYLDLGQLIDYWSPARFNHHTAPTSMVYGLREALRAVQGEGLAARFARHRLHGEALRAGVDALGLALIGAEPPERRLPFVTPVVVPEGVDELRVRRRLIEDFGIEIGAAFGPLQGRIWRIGTMGYSARRENVLLCLAALEHVLRGEGWDSGAGVGVDAALAHYASAGAIADIRVDESLGAGGIGRV